MDRTQELLNAYRQADDDHRLYLFLSHPALRQDFMQIDLTADQAVARPQKRKSIVMAWLNRCLTTYCYGVRPLL